MKCKRCGAEIYNSKDLCYVCEQKINGKYLDSVFEKAVGNTMPEGRKSISSQEKNCYGVDTDFNVASFEDRFYYIKQLSRGMGPYLCSSDAKGGDIHILAEIPGEYDNANICVDIDGIYIYGSTAKYENLSILIFGLDGTFKNEYKDICDGKNSEGFFIAHVNFYKYNVYYTVKFPRDVKETVQIKCMHLDTGQMEVLYNKASDIEGLFIIRNHIVFYAFYIFYTKCNLLESSGWMMLDLDNRKIDSISNQYYSPENILYNPEIYDNSSPLYDSLCIDNRYIFSFDSKREIFWSKRVERETIDGALHRVTYFEPKSLFGNRDRIVPGMPVWRMVDVPTSYFIEYFNGDIHYYIKTNGVFESTDKYGNVYDWDTNEGEHRTCDNFRVLGNYLFLKFEGGPEMQYNLSVGNSKPLRESWFNKNLPQSAIDDFNKKKTDDYCDYDGPVDSIDNFSFDDEDKIEYEFKKDSREKKIKKVVQDPNVFKIAINNYDNNIDDYQEVNEIQNHINEEGEMDADLVVEKTIGNTDIKYNICTLGSKFHIGFGVPVIIKINGKTYQSKTHKTTKGRIDRMKNLYSDNGVKIGDIYIAKYFASAGVITLEKKIK